jgi:hypothetical protein
MKRLTPTLLALAATITLGIAAQPAVAQSIPNPLGPTQTVKGVLINVLRALLGLLGLIGVFMFIWGGFQFLLAGGNPELVKKGKATLFWSSLGLMIIIGSWVIVRFILETATNSTS